MTTIEPPIAQASFTSQSDSCSSPGAAQRSLTSVSQTDFDFPLGGSNVKSHKEKSSDFSAHLWSMLPSIPTFLKAPFNKSPKENKLPAESSSVPLKTFSKASVATPQVSGVVARRENETDMETEPAEVSPNSDLEQFELAKVESGDSKRRSKGRRKLEHQYRRTSNLPNWLPFSFRSSSESSQGFVQHLVLQTLLSPASEPGPNSNQMGRRLYALMTSSPLGYQGPPNLLATQFRPKIDLYSDELADGDYARLSQQAQEDNRVVELGSIRHSFVPHKAHRLSAMNG
ncbi:hypothetical protein DSO57_1037263 [Entomophthora muscae]|uniref:Uncharacterized protein n=1 Tax=Entomophthora muscae TaxID=34485 RepID=A0ACC2TLF7_9FUNG|nr:hypothetical protein DSO57_1037263 [Entomophthora muscae]